MGGVVSCWPRLSFNKMRNHNPIELRKFNGIYNRGSRDDVPMDHFYEASNVVFIGDEVATRKPLYQVDTINNIRRIHLFQRRGESSARRIILNTSGAFFDSAVSLVTPFLTVATATDFSCVTFYNRLYITPHNGTEGILNEYVYVWDGTTLRTSGGNGPSTAPTFAAAGTGIVDAGIHLCAYVYETATGYITRPSNGSGDAPYIVARTVTAGQDVRFNNIPVGPAGTTARWILMSKRIDPLSYTSDVLGYEMFFAHRVSDNSTTTYTYNKYDTELQQSADYLFDQLVSIPAGVCIGKYNNRLIVGGFASSSPTVPSRQPPVLGDTYVLPYDLQSLMYVSNPGEPESISSVDGLLTVDPTEYGNVRNFTEFRKMLLITKPSQTYLTEDNGGPPTSWDVVPIDKGIGAECNGIATCVLSRGSSADVILIASYEGLMLYNGVMSEFPLTWKISELWRLINKQYMNLVQVVQDSQSRNIYIKIPDGTLIVGDYSKGLNYKDIRWSTWTFTNASLTINSISLSITSSGRFELTLSSTNNTYAISPGGDVADYRDLATYGITTNITFPNFYQNNGWFHHLGLVTLRTYSSSPITVYGISGVTSTLLGTISNTGIGRTDNLLANIQNHKIGLSISCVATADTHRLQLSEVILHMKPLWASRPL